MFKKVLDKDGNAQDYKEPTPEPQTETVPAEAEAPLTQQQLHLKFSTEIRAEFMALNNRYQQVQKECDRIRAEIIKLSSKVNNF